MPVTIVRDIYSAHDETPRIINIDMPGVCPYLSRCHLKSPPYALQYHSDIRERMRYHVLNADGKGSSWGCAVGGISMKHCSGYKMLEKGWTHCSGPPSEVIETSGWLKNDTSSKRGLGEERI